MGAGRVPGARLDTGADTSLLRHSARSLAKRAALLAARAHSIRQTSTSVVLTSYQAPERGSTRLVARTSLPCQYLHSTLLVQVSIVISQSNGILMSIVPVLQDSHDENLGAATRSSVSWSR